LQADPDIAAYSRRIRFGAMVSNFTETTNMRFTAVFPEEESKTCPALTGRIKAGNTDPASFVKPGSVVIPENIASGMNLKVGSDIVVIANNKDGSVNALTLQVSGIAENILGPQGKDGYMHIEDARTILQLEKIEITEIAVKLHDFNTLETTVSRVAKALPQGPNPGMGQNPGPGKNPVMGKNPGAGKQGGMEVHTWEELSPFSSIANIITLLLLIIRIVLIFIVVTSILNVMIMSVYERVGEIGTIASIGTIPSRIVAMFLSEGLILGFVSALAGVALGISLLLGITLIKPHFTFGRMDFLLTPGIPVFELFFITIIVLIISAIASLQPAIKASRMEPVDALRHV
jgi:putative ABC transport system permease protein